MPGIVVDREMLGAAIVPYGERARRPADPAGKLGTNGVDGEKVDKRRALGLGHVRKTNSMAAIEIERLAAGRGMGADDRVRRLVGFGIGETLKLHAADVSLTIDPSAAALEGRVVDADDAAEQLAHTLGQRLVGEVLVGEKRVATIGRRLLGIEQRR